MGYNIAICDDDNLMAQNIKNSMLHEFSNKGWQDVIIDYYEDGTRLLSSIEADNSYRVVLLDINMEPMDGFQIAEQIAKSNSKILIVFVTSHEETVYDSFDYMPFYFIRKSRYEISVKRVVNKIIDRENHEKKIMVESKDGLVAKNAILIVEFAKEEVEKGRDVVSAALKAAHLRFRPIVMTSLAFILGLLPLVFASGPGSASRQGIGTGVFFGMLVAISVGIVFVPFFFVWIYRIKAKLKKR